MAEGPMKEMLEAGVHFGHQTTLWNPKMKPYIFGAKGGIHIINLQKTVPMAQAAYDFVTKTVSHGGNVLFVGTKKQAHDIVAIEATRCKMFYVNQRWLGGTLTNFQTIKGSIDRLKELERKRDTGELEGLTKKEKLWIERDIIKLTQSLGGIKDMTRPPEILFIIDPNKEKIALTEARTLGIHVTALADTNCNPDGVDYLIPGNDDATKAIALFASKVADACLAGLDKRESVLKEKIDQEDKQKGARKGDTRDREKVVGGRGVAYVSKADAYENKLEDGKFTSQDQAAVATADPKGGQS